MLIAVDARPLAVPMTGIGRYTQRLLQEMTKAENEWLLYSDGSVLNDFACLENVTVRSGALRPSGAVSLGYSQLGFRHWLKKDKPDLFWSPRHHLPIGIKGEFKQVVTIHDVVWKRYPQSMQWQTRWAEKLFMGRSICQADKVVCVSRFTQSEVAAFWPDQSHKCVVVRSGGGLNYINNELSPKLDRNKPYALFVGTPEPRKNLRRLIKAFARLIKENKIQSDLVIVGAGGWGGEDIDSVIQSEAANKHIVILGHVSDNDLQTLYRGAEFLVMPSLYEGFGLPVLEAMRYGVPSLVSEGGSLAEVAGDSGLLVDPQSVDSIALGLETMFNDEVMRKSLSDNAVVRAKGYSWSKAAKETLTIFESLTKN